MDIECNLVGGMWDESLGIYYKGGAHCLQSEALMTTFRLVGAFGSIFLGFIGTDFFYRARNRETIEYFVNQA